jgi:hypothetical protein
MQGCGEVAVSDTFEVDQEALGCLARREYPASLAVDDGFDAASEVAARAGRADPDGTPHPVRGGDHTDHHRIGEVARREFPHGF